MAGQVSGVSGCPRGTRQVPVRGLPLYTSCFAHTHFCVTETCKSPSHAAGNCSWLRPCVCELEPPAWPHPCLSQPVCVPSSPASCNSCLCFLKAGTGAAAGQPPLPKSRRRGHDRRRRSAYKSGPRATPGSRAFPSFRNLIPSATQTSQILNFSASTPLLSPLCPRPRSRGIYSASTTLPFWGKPHSLPSLYHQQQQQLLPARAPSSTRVPQQR